jgi:hypothetical protein
MQTIVSGQAFRCLSRHAWMRTSEPRKPEPLRPDCIARSQRAVSRFAFLVARECMGLSPRCASRATEPDSWDKAPADRFVVLLMSLACRRSACRGVRLCRQRQHQSCNSHALVHGQDCELEIHPQQVSPMAVARLCRRLHLLSTHQDQFATIARTGTWAALDHPACPGSNDLGRGPEHFARSESELHPQVERSKITHCTKTSLHRDFLFGLRLRSVPRGQAALTLRMRGPDLPATGQFAHNSHQKQAARKQAAWTGIGSVDWPRQSRQCVEVVNVTAARIQSREGLPARRRGEAVIRVIRRRHKAPMLDHASYLA